jgi:PilZ domain
MTSANRFRPSRDRRFAPRRDMKIQFRFGLRKPDTEPEWANLPEQTLSDNFSEAGLFFTTSLQLEIGERVDLVFNMPAKTNEGVQWVCAGHVARITPRVEGNRGVGVQFDWSKILPLKSLQADGATEP